MKEIFITFEGIEGCGKSTQVELLFKNLKARGLSVVKTLEPGGTKIGDMVRRILLDPNNREIDPMTELMLYGASRTQHIKEVILPALDEGKIVICDRFSDATIAYQGYGRGLNINTIKKLDLLTTGGLRPSITILLDIEPLKGLKRAKKRIEKSNSHREGRFEEEKLSFHRRVREGYLKLAEAEPERIKVIRADGTKVEIHKTVREVLKERFRWH